MEGHEWKLCSDKCFCTFQYLNFVIAPPRCIHQAPPGPSVGTRECVARHSTVALDLPPSPGRRQGARAQSVLPAAIFLFSVRSAVLQCPQSAALSGLLVGGKGALVSSAQLKQLWQRSQPPPSSALMLSTPRFGDILILFSADPVQLCQVGQGP